MVEAANISFDLKALEKLVQRRLHSEPLQIVPLQVSCLMREETLIILVQHSEPIMPYPRLVFRLLRQMLEDEQISGRYKVLMYLKVNGQNEPYAFHTLNIKETQRDIKETQRDIKETQQEILEEDNFVSIPEEIFADEVTPDERELDENEEFETFREFSSIPWESVSSESGMEFNDLSEDNQEIATKKIQKSWLPIIAVGTGFGLIALAGSLFLITRPCVIGSCKAIPQAQELAQESANIITQPQSGQRILNAQKQLIESIEVLQSIPPWSLHYSEAQSLVGVYRARLETLDEIVNALNLAYKGASLSQKQPLSVEQWQEVQQLWREAIARLEKLPPDNEFYNFAQEKIILYQKNLEQINQRLNEERKAQANLEAAKQAAKIADVRQGVAQSLSNWQLVSATWETSLKHLKQVNKGTTSYNKAQELLQEYIPKMAKVRDRKNQEQFAYNAYNQSTRLAALAKKSESINQWSTAVFHWRNALTYIKQVPNNSFQSKQAQPLVSSYQNALAKAETQLKIALTLQQANQDLEQTCSGITKVCNYSIKEQLIQVNLTPNYIQEVRETALKAKVEAKIETQNELVTHISTLDQALAAISNNANVRLDVYNSDKILLTTYLPKR